MSAADREGGSERADSAADAGSIDLVPSAPTVTPIYPIYKEGTGGEIALVAPARPLSENPAAVYLAALAPGSRRTMRQALDTMAALLTGGRVADALELDWSLLRYPHTAALRSILMERYSAATVNKMLSALRGALKAAWRLGLMSAEERERAGDLAAVAGERLPRGRSLAPGEIRALVHDCLKDGEDGQKGRIGGAAAVAESEGEPRALAARDAAVLALLYGCGLRRAEVIALDLEDVRDEEAGVSLVVRGKRNKERLVPVAGGAEAALRDWIAVREACPRVRAKGSVARDSVAVDAGGDDSASPAGSPSPSPARSPLFTPFRKGGRREERRMTTQAVYHLCRERQQRTGVAPFSPHDFRRTFVGDLLDHGADIVTVQKLAGHASVTTTARYDRRGERAKRKAAELLHVPYQRG